MDVAVVTLSKVTDRTNGLIWNLNSAQERRSRKGKGCGSVHHSWHRAGPTGSSAKSWGKHNFFTPTTTCVGCQRYPSECAKCAWGLPGRVDAVFGTEGLSGQMMRLARTWCHFAALSAMLPSSLGAGSRIGPTTGNQKLFLGCWEKHWSCPSPFHWIKLLLGQL